LFGAYGAYGAYGTAPGAHGIGGRNEVDPQDGSLMHRFGVARGDRDQFRRRPICRQRLHRQPMARAARPQGELGHGAAAMLPDRSRARFLITEWTRFSGTRLRHDTSFKTAVNSPSSLIFSHFSGAAMHRGLL